MDIHSVADFLKFIIPLLGAVSAWILNERRKRIDDEYSRKEKKYESLIEGLRGFYDDMAQKRDGKDLKARFLQELNKAWLYCPDEVIQKAYQFLNTVKGEGKYTQEQQKAATGELMLAIRKDLLSRKPVKGTSLTPQDFQFLVVGP